MAAKYGVGIAQLCIRYCLQLGLLPLPKTTNVEHMRSNAAVDFVISDEDMATLKGAHGQDYGEASKFPVFGKSRYGERLTVAIRLPCGTTALAAAFPEADGPPAADGR